MILKIENEDLRKDLNEINSTIAKIITTIEKNPEKVKKLKNFFDYYLPVTVKLVDRYDEIENQKINSEEEKTFNTTTEKTIKEINGVFKQFLNIFVILVKLLHPSTGALLANSVISNSAF